MATDTGFGMCRIFDDFLGDTFSSDMWTVAEDGGAAGAVFVINTQVNGVIRGTVTNNTSTDIEVIYGAVNWEADDAGPLTFECRIKPITSLSQLIFVGLSDEGKAERPIDYNGGTQTTTATDAVGFYYAGGVSSATWRCGGVKNGSDSTHTAASSVYDPVLTTYQTFRVVVAVDGSASFYIDGNIIVENVASCVTASTSLCPIIAITDDGAAASLDVDYIYVSKGRV